MPLLGIPIWYWLVGAGVVGAAAGGATVYSLDQPETVINLPQNATPDQIDAILGNQSATLGDGLKATGNGLALAAIAALTIYYFNKKG